MTNRIGLVGCWLNREGIGSVSVRVGAPNSVDLGGPLDLGDGPLVHHSR
jgi:hypothetical protein